MPSLRFYLSGESNLIHTLYELLCEQLRADRGARSHAEIQECAGGLCRRDALRPVGFAEDEGMLPYPRRSFIGYRLLQEYFCFPQKFFFLDLSGLEQVCAGRLQRPAPRSSS